MWQQFTNSTCLPNFTLLYCLNKLATTTAPNQTSHHLAAVTQTPSCQNPKYSATMKAASISQSAPLGTL